MAGEIKRGLGTLIGNAGEYYVMAELLSRQVIAALAPRNAPAFDILATKGARTVRIRVKSKRAQYTDWQWNAKEDGTIFRMLGSGDDDFTVLVDLTTARQELSFWICPTAVVDTWLRDDFAQWLATPGAKGQQRSASNRKRHISYPRFRERLRPYHEAWDGLWVASNPPERDARAHGTREAKVG